MILSRSGRRPRRSMSINSPVAQRYRDNEFLLLAKLSDLWWQLLTMAVGHVGPTYVCID